MQTAPLELSLSLSREMIQFQNIQKVYSNSNKGALSSDSGSSGPIQDILDLGRGGHQGFSQESVLTILRQSVEVKFSGKMEDLNALLEKRGVKPAQDLGAVDLSPEATARRIVDFAVGFFPAYRESNPDLSEEEALESFMSIVQGAVDEGFAEARQIIGGLSGTGSVPSDVEETINATYDLVKQYLEEFRKSVLNGSFDPASAIERQNTAYRQTFGVDYDLYKTSDPESEAVKEQAA